MENPSVADRPAGQTTPQAPANSQSTPKQVSVNDSDTECGYANFCRITGTPEELLIDFGLNPQPMGVPEKPIVVSQRIVTSWHTAKRLLAVLQMTVARHEAAFGVLETDVQRRIRR